MIKQWNDISKDFKHSILLGNGASIAIYNEFNYSSLKDKAEEKGYLTEALSKSKIKRIAVSVFHNDLEFFDRINSTIHNKIRSDIDITFFDSQSEGCWIHHN